MNPARLVRQVVRRARQVPGYRTVRRRALAWVRDSDTARDVANRVFSGSQARSDRLPQRFPSAGNLLAGLGVDQLPVIMVVLAGVPQDRVGAVIDEVAQLQLLGAAFRPVFVLDSPQLAAPRRYGYPAELLVSQDSWDFADPTWEDYAAQRFADIRTHYRVEADVTVSGDGLTEVDRALLEAAGRTA